MVPVPAGLIVQVTAVFAEPVTVDVNCCVWAAKSVAVAGASVTVTGTAGGLRVTVPDAFFVVSLTLVAITATVCTLAMDAGAVYKPVLLTDPTDGLMDHVTAVLPSPVTVAVNCCVCPARSVALAGLTETGESSVTVEERLFVGSATLVAVTIMLRWLPRIAGAVYKPDALIVPTVGLMVQVTPVIVFWFT